MKKFIASALLLVLACPAFAVSRSEVELRASTVAGAAVGGLGQLDTTSPDRLIFRAAGHPDLVMPYAQITVFGSRQQVAHHLGILSTIGVSLVKGRQQVHLLTVSYTDTSGVLQVATFELGKHIPDTILPVLQARATNACEQREFGACHVAIPSPNRKPLTP